MIRDETSPFLRRHARDPVPWQPWTPATLATARAHSRPIFLSIGFAACHVCQVMQRETFADPEVGRLLADHFVCVLVDRDERPDVDTLYLDALRAISGRAGWPANLFLMPSAEPFYGAGYLPRDDFARLVRAAAAFHAERPSQAQAQAGAVLERLTATSSVEPRDHDLAAVLEDARRTLLGEHDARHGGFGAPPKFPAPTALDFLLLRAGDDRDGAAARAVRHTLDAMAEGAIHDAIGGGFHRYAADRAWRAPHFEKVLGDNLVLALTYARAASVLEEPRYARVAERAFDFILRDLRREDALLAAGLGATTGGEAGATYLWTPSQLGSALSAADARAATQLLWPPVRDADDDAPRVLCAGGLDDGVRERLLQARASRAQPPRIDTVLVSDTGLAIGALASAAAPLRRPDLLSAALPLAEHVVSASDGGRLPHLLSGGAADVPGTLDDHAAVADGMLTLHQATGSRRWLKEAVAIVRSAVSRFADEQHGGFFSSASDVESLAARLKQFADRPAPAGNSLLALALMRCATLTGDDALNAVAARALRLAPVALVSVASPALIGHMLFAVAVMLAPPRTLTLGGPVDDPALAALRDAALERLDPTLTVLHDDGDGGGATAPAAHLCVAGRCLAAQSSPDGLRKALAALEDPTDGPVRT